MAGTADSGSEVRKSRPRHHVPEREDGTPVLRGVLLRRSHANPRRRRHAGSGHYSRYRSDKIWTKDDKVTYINADTGLETYGNSIPSLRQGTHPDTDHNTEVHANATDSHSSKSNTDYAGKAGSR